MSISPEYKSYSQEITPEMALDIMAAIDKNAISRGLSKTAPYRSVFLHRGRLLQRFREGLPVTWLTAERLKKLARFFLIEEKE